ncbi:toMV susceptible protein tm-2 isoform X1 [Triticum aestivum]|nr:toMV susceptible protein tm-2-like isoform X1 [Triticum aestivum]
MWRKYLTGCCTQIIIRHGLSGQIKRINRRLQKISENQKEYKIEHRPSVTLTSSTTATSSWRDDYTNAVRFDKDIKTIEKMLLRKDHPQPMLISILGESGVGKRTLASIISDNMKAINHFEILAETAGYNMPTTEALLQKIHYQIAHQGTRGRQPDDEEGIDITVTDKIRRLLEKKRYLVIIGDISSKTMLNCLWACLPDDNNGSRVVLILDTENEEVASYANAMNKNGINGIHQLNRLDEERSGQLFCSRVLRKREYNENDEYMSIYDRFMFRWRKEQSNEEGNMRKYHKIVYDITGGYPLAIVVLAGLLRFKEKPGQWEALLQQLNSASASGMEEAQGNQITGAGLHNKWEMSPTTANLSTGTTIERVFWASFEDLPNDLKSCLLYFAAFPKNSAHYADELVRMWMAEGFIKPQKGKTMEELGHNYLKELVVRCLVQIEDMNDVGGINKVMVHRSFHGFLHSEAHEAGFIEVHDKHDIFVPPSVRRLSYHSLNGRYTTFTNKFPKLRSFLCQVSVLDQDQDANKDWYDLKFLRGSKFLRVISSKGLRLDSLPDEIGDLVHLRYLRVQCLDLQELPSSIKRLLNLQTLDLRGTQVNKIDACFWKIKTLRHVFADKLMLPASITEELNELQTLHGVKPDNEGEWNQHNCPLLKMTKLRSLNLCGFKHDKHGAALEGALTKMHLLGRLKLQGDVIPSCVFTAHSLRYLQMLVLSGTIKWAEVASDVRKVRPNLVQLIVFKSRSEEVPHHIKDQLQEMLEVIDE